MTLGTIVFAVAVAHTFFTGFLKQRLPRSLAILGEVEWVFAIWAIFFLVLQLTFHGFAETTAYVRTLSFHEPLLVFVLMSVAGTRGVVGVTSWALETIAQVVPLASPSRLFLTVLVLGPLAGSLITEPAAMTVTALILKRRFFDKKPWPPTLLYATIAVLFVNVSVGGVLTHFAAPAVVLVARSWGWDTAYMWHHFGWKALIVVVLNAGTLTFLVRHQLRGLRVMRQPLRWKTFPPSLGWRHPIGVFAFLSGLVVLAGQQGWWIQPLIGQLEPTSLFWLTTGLTAITDNAGLTLLGSQIPDLSTLMKHALVAGAVAGGGLTVIANAPNPAGLSILEIAGFRHERLFLAALVPTLIAAAVLLI